MKLTFKDELISLLRQEIDKAGSAKAWAMSNGVSQQYVNDFLHDRRPTGDKIARALGFAPVIVYQRIK